MTPLESYKFCPRCASPLEIKGTNMLTCTDCKNHVFINASAAVGIIIENEKSEILMAIRAHDPGKGKWDVPGGIMMPNESIEQTAIREANEELGVQIKTGKIFANFPTLYKYQDIDIPLIDIFITATIESGTPTANDDVAEIHFVSKKEALKLEIWTESVSNAIKNYIESNNR